MKSNMPAQKDFSKVPQMSKQRSVFNRSHTHKTTFDVDYLVPFYHDEILPGDSQDLTANIFARLSSTLEFPIMDNLHLDTFFFFVPNRLLWVDKTGIAGSFEKMMGERIDPGDSIDFTIPQVTSSAVQPGELQNYLGVPVSSGNAASVSALHSRAYIKIYNEWFRDENLQDSIVEYTDDGPQVASVYPIQKRGKRHDYFTSALPTPQKGTAASFGFSGTAPVSGDGKSLGFTDMQGAETNFGMYAELGGLNSGDAHFEKGLYNRTLPYDGGPVGTVYPDAEFALGITTNSSQSGLHAHLSGLTILVEELRLAIATQQFLELDSRSGSRYTEILKAHFGVTVPDYRLQRSEYLGGGSQMINVNPVTQTSEAGTTPQGTQSAFVTATSKSGYSKSFVEFGVVIGIVNVRADLTYGQGISRMMSRNERLDFYDPIFANLGEQEILNQEIFHDDTAADILTFGFAERWSEYRYYPSRITGKFSVDATGSLDAWHLSEDFAALPVLNGTFITPTLGTPSTGALDRVMTITTEPDIIFDSYIELKHARPMPVYSIPGLHRL